MTKPERNRRSRKTTDRAVPLNTKEGMQETIGLVNAAAQLGQKSHVEVPALFFVPPEAMPYWSCLSVSRPSHDWTVYDLGLLAELSIAMYRLKKTAERKDTIERGLDLGDYQKDDVLTAYKELAQVSEVHTSLLSLVTRLGSKLLIDSLATQPRKEKGAERSAGRRIQAVEATGQTPDQAAIKSVAGKRSLIPGLVN